MAPLDRSQKPRSDSLGNSFGEARHPSASCLPEFPANYAYLPADFELYRDRQRTLPELKEWFEIARAEIAHFSERLFNHPHNYLEAIGAVYRPDPVYSPLLGFQSRLPQDVLEIAFVRKFFYETLMTHPSIAVAYQLIDQSGLRTAKGNRFPNDHPLLQVSGKNGSTSGATAPPRAYTFEDFGFPARVPNPQDTITESTTRALAMGGTLSWLTHKFPSQYVMGSAMPELWSDMSLAAGAKMFMLMVTPCDGAVATPEQQLQRYRSAKELILRDPAILNHPYRDFVLPSGENMKDFLTRCALRHLGAAIKPGKDIVKKYKPLIEEEGCRVVEVYDPGCTKLLLESVRRLRDAYGDDLEILSGRIPPDPHLPSLLGYTIELNKERVVMREGLLDGKICKTHQVSGGMAPMNVQTAARIIQHAEDIAGESGNPVIVSVEGGASARLSVAIAAGIAGVGISGSLAGAVVEQVPSLHEFAGGMKPYGGEASEVVKIKGGRTNAVGDPLQVEGVSGSTRRSGRAGVRSLAQNLFESCVGITKGARFERNDSVLGGLSDPSLGEELILFSPDAVRTANVHI